MSREGRCNRLVGQTNQTGRQDLHIIRLSTRGFPLSKVKQNPALQSLLLFSNQSNWTQITVSFHFAGYAWKNKELSSHWDVRASGGLMEKWNDDIAMKVNIKCNSCDFPFKPFFFFWWNLIRNKTAYVIVSIGAHELFFGFLGLALKVDFKVLCLVQHRRERLCLGEKKKEEAQTVSAN